MWSDYFEKKEKQEINTYECKICGTLVRKSHNSMMRTYHTACRKCREAVAKEFIGGNIGYLTILEAKLGKRNSIHLQVRCVCGTEFRTNVHTANRTWYCKKCRKKKNANIAEIVTKKQINMLLKRKNERDNIFEKIAVNDHIKITTMGIIETEVVGIVIQKTEDIIVVKKKSGIIESFKKNSINIFERIESYKKN